MELSGHSGEIFSARFDPTGNLIASGGMDRSISEFLVWPQPLPVLFFPLNANICPSALANLWRL